jgi:hypothetical protein
MPTPNGPRNQPRFDTNDDADFAADLTTVGEYAATFALRRTGTSTQRAALSGNDVYEGLYFWETDTKSGYLLVGGTWTLWDFDSGWLAIPSRSANFNTDNGASYNRKVSGGQTTVSTRGQLTRVTGNLSSTDGLFTFPVGSRPPFDSFFFQPIGSGVGTRIKVGTDGRVEVAGLSSTGSYVTLDNIRFNPNS